MCLKEEEEEDGEEGCGEEEGEGRILVTVATEAAGTSPCRGEGGGGKEEGGEEKGGGEEEGGEEEEEREGRTLAEIKKSVSTAEV